MDLEEILNNKCIMECLENKVRECDCIFYKSDEVREEDINSIDDYLIEMGF